MNMYIGPCGIDTCARHRLVRAGGRVEVFCDVHEPGYQAFRREMKKLNSNTDGAAAAFRVATKLGWQPVDWTCIYCSRRWPATMDIEVLQDHVLVCDEHPTRKLRDP